jgi:hypothetical protein
MKTQVFSKHQGGFYSIVLVLFFLLLLREHQGYSQVSVTYTTAGTFTFTAPAGVTQVTAEVWGGGGRGGTRTSGSAGGGAGGGAYSKLNIISVIPGTDYSITIGTGGNATTIAGGDSYFISTTTVLAKGGNGVANNTTSGSTGGASASGVGDTKYNGGNGANGSSSYPNFYGGGGGSSAGPGANGNSSTSQSGASAPTGGGDGGDGGGMGSNGSDGNSPGGGGGGAYRFTGTRTGGIGGAGKAVITFACPQPTITNSTPLIFCEGSSVVLNAPVNQNSYKWYLNGSIITGANSSSYTATTSGSYTVNVGYSYTFPNATPTSYNCSSTSEPVVVTVHPSPVASTNVTGVTCYAGADGAIHITATGGTSPYTFSINNGATYPGSGASEYTFTGLTAGSGYKIRVKDNIGCESPVCPVQ